MAWDLSLSLDREGGRWNYDVQIEPQDEDDQPELEAAWEKVKSKGFDLKKLLLMKTHLGDNKRVNLRFTASLIAGSFFM